MSRPDDLVDQLGALEREYDETYPHEWEELVRGTRCAEEIAQARLEAGDDPAEVRELAELLSPMDERERASWVERFAAKADHHEEVASLDEHRRARAPWLTVAVGVLVAAALVLWLVPRAEGPAPAQPSNPMPGFSLVVRNQTVHEIRSASADPDPDTTAIDRYQSDTAIHWVLRPERSVATSFGLRVLAEAVGPKPPNTNPIRLIDPQPVTISEGGVIEVRGTLASLLDLPPGRWSLRFVIDPSPPTDLAAYERGRPWPTAETPYVIDIVP